MVDLPERPVERRLHRVSLNDPDAGFHGVIGLAQRGRATGHLGAAGVEGWQKDDRGGCWGGRPPRSVRKSA
jgi:hypothetical protein